MIVAAMQPCYLPWRGYFALLRACDVLVHLDDVALPRGRTYQTRTAVKTAQGRRWLTLPVRRRDGQLIRDVELADDHWRRKHLATLRQELPESVDVVADLLQRPWTGAADLSIALAERISEHLDLGRRTVCSTALDVHETGSDRILAICRSLDATGYVTGHGALRYLDHDAFERAGIAVSYLDYDLSPWPQPHGPFDPYVTMLDAIAHADEPAAFANAALIPWRRMLELAPA